MCSRDEIKAITSPSRSLEFRTAGFPQYGFKASLSDATCRPTAEINSVEVDAVVTDGHPWWTYRLSGMDEALLRWLREEAERP